MTRHTREEMYSQVWSQPLTVVSMHLGCSDVALAKACRRANVPVPQRGHWAKKNAGKHVIQPLLPPRFPGATYDVLIGENHSFYDWRPVKLSDPLPEPQSFTETLDDLRSRVVSMVGKAECPRIETRSHPLIRRLIEIDAARASKYEQYQLSWHKPWFSASLDKRRLRVMNAIMLFMEGLGCTSFIQASQHVNKISEIRFSIVHKIITIDSLDSKSNQNTNSKSSSKRLFIAIGQSTAPQRPSIYWEDTDQVTLEQILDKVVIELLVSAEISYRDMAERQHKNILDQRARIAEENKRRNDEEERKARELSEKIEKESFETLLAHASSHQNAVAIRNFVAVVLANTSRLSTDPEVVSKWASWAHAQADRIDPLCNMSFLRSSNNG